MNSQNFSFCESFWNFVKSILYRYGEWIRFGSLFADWTRYRVFDFPFSHWQWYICSAPHPHRTSCSEVGSQPLLPKELSSICCQVFLTRRSHTGVQFNFYCFCFFHVSSILHMHYYIIKHILWDVERIYDLKECHSTFCKLKKGNSCIFPEWPQNRMHNIMGTLLLM